MDKRDRLFKMLVEADYMVAGDVVPRSPAERWYAIVDYLFAHGVEIPPCKVGDTVYQTDGERVYESVVKNVLYDTDGIAFDETAIGESVFLYVEEAEIEKRRLENRKDCSS
ncbi:MAG: hypothetical protein II333_13140 [Clostridia bacterium]|nr:hypothetical protein [Clostridia bacterium]